MASNDEYRWMQDINSEEVIRHLEQENRYTAASLRPLSRRTAELHMRLAERQPEEEGGDQRSVPERLGDNLYYTRRDEDKGFPLYVRRPVQGTLDDEQVVFDLNDIEEHGLRRRSDVKSTAFYDRADEKRGDRKKTEAGEEIETEPGFETGTEEGHVQPPPTPALGSMKLSPDQRMLACTVDVEGNDQFMLAVFHLGAGGGKRRVTVLREDAMWDDVIGVEWGSTWPTTAADGSSVGDDSSNSSKGSRNSTASSSNSYNCSATSGSNGDDGGGKHHCYELYYTVPDELRRPWQVRSVIIQPSKDTETAKAVSTNRSNQIPCSSRDFGSSSATPGSHCSPFEEDRRWTVDSATDRAVFEEKDDAFFVDVGKTKDSAFVVINVHSKTTSEVYFLPTSSSEMSTRLEVPFGSSKKLRSDHGDDDVVTTMRDNTGNRNNGSSSSNSGHGVNNERGRRNIERNVVGGSSRHPVLLRRRRPGVEYYVDHCSDAFYLVTNAPHDVAGGGKDESAAEAAAALSATGAAREYRLVRIQQRKGSNSLEGIADAPWEPVSFHAGNEKLPSWRSSSSSSSCTTSEGIGCSVPGVETPLNVCLGMGLLDDERGRNHKHQGENGDHDETKTPLHDDFPVGNGSSENSNAFHGGKGNNCNSSINGDCSTNSSSAATAAATVATAAAAAAARKELMAAGTGTGTIQEMDLFEGRCVLYESCPETGAPRLRIVPLVGDSSDSTQHQRQPPSLLVYPPTPGGCCHNRVKDDSGGRDEAEGGSAFALGGASRSSSSTLRPGVNSWFAARTARFSLSSPTAPEDVYDLCLESARLELLRRTEVPGSPRFDGGDYSCYSVQVASHDGEKVPMTIAHRRGLKLNGSNRLVLHGYGAYGMTLPIDYQPGHACMLERGWVLAFAHVRGGGERGKAWHAAGRGQNKWNTFRDFEACAEHLVSAGLTSPSRMGVHVNSAGGLVAGVMANTRPDLFSAMVMKAPFLGVLSAMRDTSLPLTVHEFDEWGDPNTSRDAEEVIRSYCPYENVRGQAYPALLVTASVNDTRVNFWDPTKWVSRVRAANTGENAVLLRVSDSDGHHGPGNTHDALKDSAMEMAFLEHHLSLSRS